MAQWYIHTFQIECCWVSECVKVGGAYIHCLTVSLCLDLMLTNGAMTIGTAPFLTVAAGLGLLGLGTFLGGTKLGALSGILTIQLELSQVYSASS